MTDMELTKLSAKAAGINVVWDRYLKCFFRDEPYKDGISGPFDPIYDDGEALRLAVSLKLAVFPPEHDSGDFAIASIPDGVVDESNSYIWIQQEVKNGDRMEATRRAIVRAAAEIGKAMK